MPTLSPWAKRFFVDCEFTDFTSRALVSIGIVSEEGDEFYAEVSDFPAEQCSDFVRAVVLPQLGQELSRVMPRGQVAGELASWLGAVPLKPRPVLCVDYAGDLELLLELIGALPRGWKTDFVTLKLNPDAMQAYFDAHGGRHHALVDARAKAASFR
jgi:hypothetical protein